MKDLLSALCLVVVIEGLLLFAVPLAWRAMAAQMLQLPLAALRRFGAVALAAGLVGLWWARH